MSGASARRPEVRGAGWGTRTTGRSGGSWGSYSYRGRLKNQSATSTMVRLKAPRPSISRASTKTTAAPTRLNTWTKACPSTPESTPPLDRASPLCHRV